MNLKDAKCDSCFNHNCLIKVNLNAIKALGHLESKRALLCRKSQNFILEGSPVHGLYFIYSGKAKVYSIGVQNREQIIRFAGNGDIVGHRGFLTYENYKISAAAVEDTVLCHFSNDVLFEMLHSVAGLSFDLMKFYAEELQRSEERVNTFSQMNVKSRVIDALVSIANKFGMTNGFINLKISRKEIADFAGTTEEQVTRVLSKLKQENLIKLDRKMIQIVNMNLILKERDL
jgi:CRP/FNR family transcriptional regulator, anaerobic regulatory protein